MSGLNTPLTPLRFLERAAEVYPSSIAIVDGDRRLTYTEFASAAQRLANALIAHGVRRGERVAYLASNSAELLIAHFGVPLAGAVLVAVNTRLSSEEVAWICAHSQARVLFGDADLLQGLDTSSLSALSTIEVPSQTGEYVGIGTSYEDFLAAGTGEELPWEVGDENSTISINYTSGTTGRPKGVMYTHRGAYLRTLGEVVHQGFGRSSRYLWTLPMFHCNGWCSTWAVTAAAGRHVCVRAVRGSEMWQLVDEEGITHLSGAPIVATTLATAPEAHPLDRPLTVVTGGAPPSPSLIEKISALGADLVQVYGLTETYGPYASCEVQEEWSRLPAAERAALQARQGVGMLTSDRVRVVRQGTGPLEDVTADGIEMGEIVMRGNTVMKGYLDDPVATEEAFAAGWFHSGDLGVMYPDGHIRLLDRAKDVVISGGENISTIEVEQALDSHPAVADVVVIGVPDDKWGERPKAFVVLTARITVTEEELIAHVKGKIASYKAPRSVEFVDALPRTSTGKVRKNELRDAEWASSALRING
ncbi:MULTISPECIES: AMP-binding protein [unclassified Rhodococcus (in: high G+C Gram-positive bacteria)]|uniref:AMP-binding protein n=1 Tax=unclassified Rhodococcus (in: high G+C Gram-positive bacteria) TaxID=192944 RepID=UPI00163B2E77|nr:MULTISPECIES: AMP-binding protein [unclassified Rhodococcus (in: high G+C Gram-positive bacteria)]MBC2637915.1 AMP-binding protein [Rhodococcus sp. 3A]MBC2897337.1 AMP-binding protein [Rhodococcus sp. 4CII]